MKKYTNTGRRLVCLCFKGEDAVYLKRGQSHETASEPVSVPSEVLVENLSSKKTVVKKDVVEE